METIRYLLAFLNHGVTPVVPEKGSVGASGDLAPTAHLGLVLIGKGEAFYGGRRISGAEALKNIGLPPLRLAAGEGLGPDQRYPGDDRHRCIGGKRCGASFQNGRHRPAP